jgi:uncharacterized protein YcaQ
LIKEIFDFDYTWEVYTPRSKRKYGYYVLPILKEDFLIGRIELRKTSRGLEKIGLWTEPGCRIDTLLLNEALQRHTLFLRLKPE